MKKMIYIIIVFICSCENSIIEPEERVFESIYLIDTFKNKLLFDTANSITEAEFHPMYIGIDKDSIHLNYWSGKIEYKTFDLEKYKRPDSNDLKIYVDTSKIIGSGNKFIIPPPPLNYEKKEVNEDWERKFYRGVIKSYPVFINNLSEDTLNVGYGEYIPLIIEAKDSLGNWKPIQESYIYFCGTGLNHYYLPPDQILLTSCKLFEGDYKTKMRITFGFDRLIESNEFKGRINYKQFDEPKEKYY